MKTHLVMFQYAGKDEQVFARARCGKVLPIERCSVRPVDVTCAVCAPENRDVKR